MAHDTATLVPQPPARYLCCQLQTTAAGTGKVGCSWRPRHVSCPEIAITASTQALAAIGPPALETAWMAATHPDKHTRAAAGPTAQLQGAELQDAASGLSRAWCRTATRCPTAAGQGAAPYQPVPPAGAAAAVWSHILTAGGTQGGGRAGKCREDEGSWGRLTHHQHIDHAHSCRCQLGRTAGTERHAAAECTPPPRHILHAARHQFGYAGHGPILKRQRITIQPYWVPLPNGAAKRCLQ
jgi:hypothetical protein